MPEVDPDNEATYKVCVIPSDLKETCRPKASILAELEACGFTKEAAFGVKLALEEALSNAVKHGSSDDRSSRITIRYAVTPEKAVILVRDQGPGFSPGEIPDPTTPDRLSLPDGRGIMLIKAYMDEVTFRDDGREVRFVKLRG